MELTPPFNGNDALRLLDGIPTATLFSHPDGSIRFANAAARALFGYSDDEMLGLHRRDLLDESDPRVQAAIAEPAATGFADFDITCRRKDGTRFTAQISSSIVAGPRDETWVALSLRNVTAERDREEHLIANIEQLAFALNRFPAVLPRLLEKTAGSGPAAADTARPAEAALLLDRSPEATIFGRPDGRIVTANAAACALLGYRKDEVPRLHRRDLVDVDDPRFKASQAARERSGFAEGELEFRRKDGSRFLGQFRSTEFKAPDGTGWICISLRDVSEPRRLERDLRASEQRYRALVSGMLEGVVLFDADARILAANPAACEILGRSEHDVIGQRPDSVHWQTFHRDGAPMADAELPVSVVLNSGMPVRNATVGLRRPDGAMRWLVVNANPLFDADSTRPASVVVSFSDFTEQEQAARALRESEERWRSALDGVGDGVWDWNIATGAVHFSRRWKEMLGFTDEEIENRVEEWKDRVHPDDLPQVMADVAAYFDGRTAAYRNEHRVACRDGSWKWILDRGAVLARAPDNRPLRMIGTHFDLSNQRLAEKRLRDSEERYARVLEGSDQGFWDWDLVSGEFRVSDRFDTMLGFPPGERDLSPAMWPNYVHPDDLAVALASIERHLAGTSPAHEVEVRCLTRAGDWRWILTRGRIVEHSADGRPTIMSGTFTDIHERKAIETALRQSEARFRAMIEIAPVPCALNDDEHRILFLNDAFVCTFGYTLDDIPTVEDWWSHAYPDPAYRRWVKDEWRTRLARTTAEGSVFPPLEIAIQCKDGTLRTVMSSATAIGADFGSTHLVILYDISSLKRNEAALRASHDRLRLVTAHSADVISLHDAAGRYLFVSDASRTLIGHSDAELRGRDPCDLIHPDDHPLVREALRRAASESDIGVTAYRLRDRDGDYRWVESTARAVHDDQGALVEIVISTRDIGEHVRVENRLRQLAATDFLTGLPNRREFSARLGEEMARVQRGPQPAALLMLDLDHFKDVNDRYGHAVGDLVLRRFADLLRGQLRKVDSAGRVGGEEFAIVLAGADLPAALAFAERVRQHTAAALLVVEERRIGITVSIGVTAIRPDDHNADAVLARADEALYGAKHGGRNRVTLGQPL